MSDRKLLTEAEMDAAESSLDNILEDTIRCWKLTRLKNSSASLASYGNISMRLIKAFDEIKCSIDEKELEQNDN